MECWECDKDGFESKKSLRMHQISSGEYDKENFNQKFKELSESQTGNTDTDDDNVDDNANISQGTESTDSDTDSSVDNSDDSDSVKLEDVSGGMDETDLDKLVESAEEADKQDLHDAQESGSTTDKKGLDTAINNAWGRIATIDLDPDAEETSNMRKNIQGLAEDVGLGHNAKWYYEEELKGDTDDPKKAVMGSLLLATVMTLSVRPELAQKIQRELKNKKSGTNKNKELEDKDEDE